MAFYDAFFGSDQSLYTAYAIIAAIIAICVTILLTATDVSVGNRILIVLFVIVTLVPSIFLTLFELTCIVTGGTEPNRWWCYAFAWVLAAFIIIYCIFVVIVSLISLFTYNNAIDNLNEEEAKNKLTTETSNYVAKEIINTQEQKQKEVEKFYADVPNTALDSLPNKKTAAGFQNYSEYESGVTPPPAVKQEPQTQPEPQLYVAPPVTSAPVQQTTTVTPPANSSNTVVQPVASNDLKLKFTNYNGGSEGFEGYDYLSLNNMAGGLTSAVTNRINSFMPF